MTAKNGIFGFALIAALGLLGLLLMSFCLKDIPYASIIFTVVIILYQVVVPFEILKYNHKKMRDFNIYAHHIDAVIDLILPPYGVKKILPRFHDIVNELMVLVKVSVFTLIPYVFLYLLYFKALAQSHGEELMVTLNYPFKISHQIIIHIFVIALPEEIFYRGFLQSSLLKRWPNNRFIFGLPMGRAIIITNIIFAFAHVASSLMPLRLLTFFPGLIFSYLTYKNRSILSATLYHALCNILGQILAYSVNNPPF